MAIVKNIGKNTLGDNNKMSVRLHEYEMSTHDLSFVWRNTQSPGTLVPFMKILAQKGDVFDIKLFNKTLTHPTNGPLLGSYKLQHWVFSCPIRLYNSWLHNNRNEIGMKMSQIKFPIVQLRGYMLNSTLHNEKNQVSSSSSLAAYLGYKGIRTNTESNVAQSVNAIPYLAYWDIFKNYFANKQEKNAYYISGSSNKRIVIIDGSLGGPVELETKVNTTLEKGEGFSIETTNVTQAEWNRFWANLKIRVKTATYEKDIYADQIINTGSSNPASINATKWNTIFGSTVESVDVLRMENTDTQSINAVWKTTTLKSFALSNIDEARDKILETKGNVTLNITDIPLNPYSSFNGVTTTNGVSTSARSKPQYQLALKTYDSDIFQNWVQTDWIDGANGIAEITAVDVSDGKLTLDTLNLAQKVYNMLNRIAVSGGTYRDWLETTYTAGNYLERPETPVFEGGMTQYIEFEEVVSSAKTEDQPLGSLAGRGRSTQQHGSGQLHIKIQEPSYIIGICAITPIIDYSQGNDWDIMSLKTMDDLHKPALDGIGFEDSINNYRAYWSGVSENGIRKETSIGKTVAWINYMTNFNKTFGNFASGESESFMCLNRNYEKNAAGTEIEDLTSYIDPSKHNEIFAETDINAMNFWLQTACDIRVRRNISAKQIPNL